RNGFVIMKITFLLQRCVFECLENGIKFCSMSVPKEHIELDRRQSIMLCSRCCSLSHTRQKCTKPFQRCGNCSGIGHHFTDCPPGTPFQCPTCGEDHPVISTQCKYNNALFGGRLHPQGSVTEKENN
ncbi:unnamed protein product, partial [Meganyctiphanes norvegica]